MNQAIEQRGENEMHLGEIELVDIQDLQKAFCDKKENEDDGFKGPPGAVRGTYGCSGW